MEGPLQMPTHSPINILLVEDSPTHSELIRSALSGWERPFFLTEARTLHEARLLLSATLPDLMIVDLMLPDGRGTELLPARRELVNLPMLIMTSQGNEEEAVKAMRAGALDYLVKSSSMLSEMPRALERALREWQHIQERRKAEETLRLSEARWRSVFESAAAGMVIISPEGKFLEVNPWLCRLLGYSEGEMSGRMVTDFVHPDDREQTLAFYANANAGDCPTIHTEKRYLCRDGHTIWGHASVSCVRDDRQQPLYCIGLIQDISGRVQSEEELRRAIRELDSFVRTVSHDLRSPLTPIIGFAQLLKETYGQRLDDDAKYYLEAIIRQGNRMSALLEDLLALARIGHVERSTVAAELADIVSSVVVMKGSQLHAAGMTVTVAPLPATRLPPTLLTQLFDNLIGNAIRYSGRPGPIEIDGERIGNRLRLTVRDHGRGIPPEERSRIFELFYRCSETSEQEGTGVGLATVQKIAQLFDGSVRVEETPGGGCTFIIELTDEL